MLFLSLSKSVLVCRSRIFLYNPQADLPTVRRELHGVCQNIDQDLFKPQRVGDHILVFHAGSIDGKGDVLFIGADLYDVPNILHQPRQMHRLCLQRNLSILNAAHIQHIIDKGQKMLAGNGYLFQIGYYTLIPANGNIQYAIYATPVGSSQQCPNGHHRRILPLRREGCAGYWQNRPCPAKKYTARICGKTNCIHRAS